MTHTVSAHGKLHVLALSGEVDMHSSPAVRKVILDLVKTKAAVVVDLSAVKYMDSSGVATLVEGFQNARKLGHDFILAAPSGSVLGVIRLARLDKVFRIAASIDECEGLVG